MLEQELLFLGLLKDGPKHGYEIKRQLKEVLAPFISLEIKSIYYPLKKMEAVGYVIKDVGREGRWPEKYVYRITKEGERHFKEILNESFLAVKRPYFNIDLSLFFLRYVDPQIASRRLRARLIFLQRIKRDLLKLKNTLRSRQKHLAIILTHNIDLVEAEINSLSRLITSL
ncbi:MAG: PadR family transcriptional regulator [Candidatus Omnitrophota bacterium]